MPGNTLHAQTQITIVHVYLHFIILSHRTPQLSCTSVADCPCMAVPVKPYWNMFCILLQASKHCEQILAYNSCLVLAHTTCTDGLRSLPSCRMSCNMAPDVSTSKLRGTGSGKQDYMVIAGRHCRCWFHLNVGIPISPRSVQICF